MLPGLSRRLGGQSGFVLVVRVLDRVNLRSLQTLDFCIIDSLLWASGIGLAGVLPEALRALQSASFCYKICRGIRTRCRTRRNWAELPRFGAMLTLTIRKENLDRAPTVSHYDSAVVTLSSYRSKKISSDLQRSGEKILEASADWKLVERRSPAPRKLSGHPQHCGQFQTTGTPADSSGAIAVMPARYGVPPRPTSA